MAIENWINISGTFKKISDQYINVSGTFKKVTEKWINVSGVWRQVYNAVTGSFVGSNWTTTFNKTPNLFYFSTGARTVNVIGSGSVDVTISGDRAPQAKKNGVGLYTTGPWTAVDGDSFTIRLQASASASSASGGTLTVTQSGSTISWTIWTT